MTYTDRSRDLVYRKWLALGVLFYLRWDRWQSNPLVPAATQVCRQAPPN